MSVTHFKETQSTEDVAQRDLAESQDIQSTEDVAQRDLSESQKAIALQYRAGTNCCQERSDPYKCYIPQNGPCSNPIKMGIYGGYNVANEYCDKHKKSENGGNWSSHRFRCNFTLKDVQVCNNNGTKLDKPCKYSDDVCAKDQYSYDDACHDDPKAAISKQPKVDEGTSGGSEIAQPEKFKKVAKPGSNQHCPDGYTEIKDKDLCDKAGKSKAVHESTTESSDGTGNDEGVCVVSKHGVVSLQQEKNIDPGAKKICQRKKDEIGTGSGSTAPPAQSNSQNLSNVSALMITFAFLLMIR